MWRKKRCPRPMPSCAPLDQAGDVCDDAGLTVPEMQYPQLGFQGGKGIGSYLGIGR